MKPTVLIVDDDEAIRTQMKWALSEDYEVYFAEDRQGALDVFKAQPASGNVARSGTPTPPQ